MLVHLPLASIAPHYPGHLFGGKSRNLPIVLPNGQARNDSSGFIIGNRPYCFETFPDYYSAKSDQYLKTMKLTYRIRVPNIFCQNRFISWINLGFKAINTNPVPQEAGEKLCGLRDVDWNRQHQISVVWQWLFCSFWTALLIGVHYSALMIQAFRLSEQLKWHWFTSYMQWWIKAHSELAQYHYKLLFVYGNVVQNPILKWKPSWSIQTMASKIYSTIIGRLILHE